MVESNYFKAYKNVTNSENEDVVVEEVKDWVDWIHEWDNQSIDVVAQWGSGVEVSISAVVHDVLSVDDHISVELSLITSEVDVSAVISEWAQPWLSELVKVI